MNSIEGLTLARFLYGKGVFSLSVTESLKPDYILEAFNQKIVSLSPLGVALLASRCDVPYYEHMHRVSGSVRQLRLKPSQLPSNISFNP
jgi:hypothetical protein